MIIWGSKGEVADLGPRESKQCPTCERERTFKLMLQYKVRHVWYVFKWITDKQYALVCDVCHRGQQLVTKTVEEKIGKPPIPFMSRWGWTFLVGLVACGFLFGAVENLKERAHTQTYFAAPQRNDLYLVNVASLLKSPESPSMYAVLRVRSVSADGIEFDAAKMFYNRVNGARNDLRDRRVADAGYFAAAPVVITRERLGAMQHEGAIVSIDR
jgi:hypothetical protein